MMGGFIFELPPVRPILYERLAQRHSFGRKLDSLRRVLGGAASIVIGCGSSALTVKAGDREACRATSAGAMGGGARLASARYAAVLSAAHPFCRERIVPR